MQVQAGGGHLLRGTLESLPEGSQEFPFPFISQHLCNQDSAVLPARALPWLLSPVQVSFTGHFHRTVYRSGSQVSFTGRFHRQFHSTGIWFPQACTFSTAEHGPSVNSSTIQLTWVKYLNGSSIFL